MPHTAIKESAVTVIIGASSGIGLATAQATSKRGMKVVIADQNLTQL